LNQKSHSGIPSTIHLHLVPFSDAASLQQKADCYHHCLMSPLACMLLLANSSFRLHNTELAYSVPWFSSLFFFLDLCFSLLYFRRSQLQLQRFSVTCHVVADSEFQPSWFLNSWRGIYQWKSHDCQCDEGNLT